VTGIGLRVVLPMVASRTCDLDETVGWFGREWMGRREKKLQGGARGPFLSQKAGLIPSTQGGLRCREYE
jgi:hypothetical protein